MDAWLIGIIVFIVIIWLWISTLALLCLFLDPDLEPIQRWGQAAMVLLLPFFGASLVLMFVNEHSPEVVDRFYIPWPFKSLVLNKADRRRSGESSGAGVSDSNNVPFHNGSGGDGGGGSE